MFAAFIYGRMLHAAAYLSKKIARPLCTKDGGTLRTVLDARTSMGSAVVRRLLLALTRWQSLNRCRLRHRFYN